MPESQSREYGIQKVWATSQKRASHFCSKAAVNRAQLRVAMSVFCANIETEQCSSCSPDNVVPRASGIYRRREHLPYTRVTVLRQDDDSSLRWTQALRRRQRQPERCLIHHDIPASRTQLTLGGRGLLVNDGSSGSTKILSGLEKCVVNFQVGNTAVQTPSHPNMQRNLQFACSKSAASA